MRNRPGRYRPQFEGMRRGHDEHRRNWLGQAATDFAPGFRHWTDCDACLAIYIVDRQDEQLALYRSADKPMWQRAIFIAIVMLCVGGVGATGAWLVLMPYLQAVR